MTVAARPRNSIRLRGRSLLAFVLAPEPPIKEWITDLDDWVERSPGFFVGRPVLLDVSKLSLDREGLGELLSELRRREIRIMGIEGIDGSWLGLGMPPLVSRDRQAGMSEVLEGAVKPTSGAAPAGDTSPLLIDGPVRSGQSVIHPHGDITITGSVASGAEVVAGGSIHVYGALRGRAIAGSIGNGAARIFCGKLEAEFLGIDGLCRTADELDYEYRGRRVQIWIDGDAMKMAALN